MNLKTIFSGVRALGYGSRIRPMRDWLVLISLVGLVFVASIAWNAWFFLRVTSEESLSVAPSADTVPLLGSLPAAREILSERAAEEGRYRSFYEFVDPSR